MELWLRVRVRTLGVVFLDLEARVIELQALQEIVRVYPAQVLALHRDVVARKALLVAAAYTCHDDLVGTRGVRRQADFHVEIWAKNLYRLRVVAEIRNAYRRLAIDAQAELAILVGDASHVSLAVRAVGHGHRGTHKGLAIVGAKHDTAHLKRLGCVNLSLIRRYDYRVVATLIIDTHVLVANKLPYYLV